MKLYLLIIYVVGITSIIPESKHDASGNLLMVYSVRPVYGVIGNAGSYLVSTPRDAATTMFNVSQQNPAQIKEHPELREGEPVKYRGRLYEVNTDSLTMHEVSLPIMAVQYYEQIEKEKTGEIK
jgi:hypothetical protein